MPRGDNPNSRANLEKNKLQKGLPTKAQRERQLKGSKKGNEVKKALKSFKDIDADTTTYEEREKMLKMLKRRAEQGNIKAFEVYRDTVGLKPIDRVETNNVLDIDLSDWDNEDNED